MQVIKSVFGICFQNFRKWKKDYRIILIAIVLFILVSNYQSNINDICNYINVKPTPWTFPFLYSQFYMKLVFTVPLILLFCDAPFKDSNYMFVVVRSGRVKWAIGEIIYIIFTSAIYYIYIFALTIFMSIENCEWSMEWGKGFNTIANTNVAYQLEKYYVECSNLITSCFTPIQAIWFTFLMSWLCGIFIGLLIFFLNLLIKNKFIGISAASLAVIFSFLVANGGLQRLIQFSPISWSTLNMIDVGNYTSNPTFSYCLTTLLSLCTALSLLILICETRVINGKYHRIKKNL